MEFAFIVWAIGVLPQVGVGLTVIGCLLTVALVLAWVVSEGEFKPKLLYVSIPLWFFAALIPDKETAYAMAAAYGVQSVAENERVQKLAGSGLDVLESYLEKTKKELEAENKTVEK